MKINHVSTSDSVGGAARAAYRIHRALVEYGIDSRMRVLNSGTDDDRVTAGATPKSILDRFSLKLYNRWLAYTRRGWYTDNPILHTFGQVSAGLVDELNASDADLLNLHWISGLLSVTDIGRLKKPIVWRLADMWAFCGGDHYEPDTPAARFRNGYFSHNRPEGERGPDLNRRTWEAKRQAWARQDFTIVCTTNWLANCARESVLFANTPIHIIPNTLDTTNTWRPIPKDVARIALGLPLDKKLILIGMDYGFTNPYKGVDLLLKALDRVTSIVMNNIELVIYGRGCPVDKETWPCPIHWLGAVHDDRILALANSAVDVMVVPSRQEAFGQTASEAQACGTPVVAFDNSGPADIVIHQETGWLARAFDTEDLADGILWILDDAERWTELSRASRVKAVERYSSDVIAQQYLNVYEQVLAGKVVKHE